MTTKSSTLWLNIRGTARWVKNKNPDQEYQNWSLEVNPNEQSLGELQASGIQVNPKQDEDGSLWYKFRRPTTKVIRDELVKFGPPQTVDEKGKEVQEWIANGSEVTATIVVYDTRKGKGHRWERLTVHKLIPFERREQDITSPVSVTQNSQPQESRIPF